MAVPETHIWDRASLLLDTVVDRYATEGISLPARRYVSDGPEVAHDCEEVVVAFQRVYRGTPAIEGDAALTPMRCGGWRTGIFDIHIIRCTSAPKDDGSAPHTETIEGFADNILIDAWFLPEALTAASFDGTLAGECEEIFIPQAVMVPAAGGFGGVVVTMHWFLGA